MTEYGQASPVPLMIVHSPHDYLVRTVAVKVHGSHAEEIAGMPVFAKDLSLRIEDGHLRRHIGLVRAINRHETFPALQTPNREAAKLIPVEIMNSIPRNGRPGPEFPANGAVRVVTDQFEKRRRVQVDKDEKDFVLRVPIEVDDFPMVVARPVGREPACVLLNPDLAAVGGERRELVPREHARRDRVALDLE